LTGNEWKARALAAHGVDLPTAASVAMNEPDFLPDNAAALAEIVKHRHELTREAYDASFASSVTTVISADEYLAQRSVSDESALGPIIDSVIAAHPAQVATYRGGKEGVLGFLVGQVMRETQGKADPKVVNQLLREKLRS
jgi:glutaminyl-tRNA synthetase